MRDRPAPKLPKWPFLLADVTLLAAAWWMFWQSKTPMTGGNPFLCAAVVALGALLCVTPYLLEYRTAMKLTEADRLANAVLQLENLEIIGRQIAGATAGWQTAHEHANKSVEAAREIAEGMTTQARAFGEFLKKANDTEENHLRLEVDKLRRAENEWLQILVRILDHIFALHQAAVRSGQKNLVEELAHFQNACRDVSRLVGLVPFLAIPGELYDARVHQLADAAVAPGAEARVAETIATGYSFQGKMVRPALVTVQAGEPKEPKPLVVPSDLNREPAAVAAELPQTLAADLISASPLATDTARSPRPSAGSGQEPLPIPETAREESRP